MGSTLINHDVALKVWLTRSPFAPYRTQHEIKYLGTRVSTGDHQSEQRQHRKPADTPGLSFER